MQYFHPNWLNILTYKRSMAPISCSSPIHTKMLSVMHIYHMPHKLCFTLINVEAKIVLTRLTFELLFRSQVTTHKLICMITYYCRLSSCILITSKLHLTLSLTQNVIVLPDLTSAYT